MSLNEDFGVSQLPDRGSSTTLLRATEILGDHLLGGEAATKLDLSLSGTLNPVPFTEPELWEAKDRDLYLVAMPQVHLIALRLKASNHFFSHDWYLDEAFARVRSRPGYHLIGELPNSTNKTWTEQVATQPSGFDAPHVVEVAYLAVARLAMGKGNAFPHYLRTQLVVSGRSRVVVSLGGGRVAIGSRSSWGDGSRSGNVAVASGQFRPFVS